MNDTLTRIPGLRVGHWTDSAGLTGVSVILCESGAVGGVDQRGGAPGTRETDLLRPLHLVQEVHAIVLAGGSAFGLAAADGVVRYLAGRDIGHRTLVRRVPVVPAAILFDLEVGDPRAYPDAGAGYAACMSAVTDPVAEGNVGAGTGCSVGKLRGVGWATKSGIGSACLAVGEELLVGALVAVNALGDVLDERGAILAGVRDDTGWADSMALLRQGLREPGPPAASATVIGVVATNARLTKEQANWVAQMAHDGLARAVRPAHTLYDGDTLFCLATGAIEADANVVGAFAAEAVAAAIRRGVRAAARAGGLPSVSDQSPDFAASSEMPPEG
jgi:L-aminopeptidase/D-esterase-like protein